MHVAVVGHVEWVEFLRVPHVPAPGDIVHASERWEEPAGGGSVAAVQIARLAGQAAFFTALTDDDVGRESSRFLAERGVEVLAAERHGTARRAITHVDDAGERTITVLGERRVPHGDDPLPWYTLSSFSSVYFCGGDVAAVHAARAARVLVATPRGADVLVEAGVELDVLVHSANDRGEEPPAGLRARLVVSTEGARGGRWRAADGTTGRWAAAPLPGPVADAYGCGDSFAAGLTYGLGARMRLDDALALAARCGAAVRTGRGPYTAMIGRDDLAVESAAV